MTLFFLKKKKIIRFWLDQPDHGLTQVFNRVISNQLLVRFVKPDPSQFTNWPTKPGQVYNCGLFLHRESI
jgi:hypothetical protein